MDTENSKINECNKFIYEFTEKLNLKHPNKNIPLVNLCIYYPWNNMKFGYNNNKFEISALTWIDKFDLSNGSYSISDIRDYFEYINKKHETTADNSPVQIYTNRSNNRIVSKIKTGYKSELLSPETKKLLGGTKKDVCQDKDCEDMPYVEVVIVI